MHRKALGPHGRTLRNLEQKIIGQHLENLRLGLDVEVLTPSCGADVIPRRVRGDRDDV